MEYPVKTMDDWLKVKHWYEFSEERIDRRRCCIKRNCAIRLSDDPVGARRVRRAEAAMARKNCIACYEEPELIADMLETIGNTCVKVMERVAEIVPIDCLSIHEDMAGKSGPLFGPAQIEAFLQPYYQKIWNCARTHGAKIFSQDSDGNMNPVIDAILACGVTCLYPCEPAAGMDMMELRKKYGARLAFKGGIDKFVLRGDFKPSARAGIQDVRSSDGRRHSVAIDHRIPNGVPLANYRYYVETGRRLPGLRPRGKRAGRAWPSTDIRKSRAGDISGPVFPCRKKIPFSA
ncbi:MAG: uroporphyrinogen decarboxylase family protein [Ruthenibacterium lactatiformans]